MSVPGELHALVERFDRDRDAYRSGTYNEAQARVDFINPLEDVARLDRMVELVERMLTLHERLAGARIERERTVIGHQISATDRQIDRKLAFSVRTLDLPYILRTIFARFVSWRSDLDIP